MKRRDARRVLGAMSILLLPGCLTGLEAPPPVAIEGMVTRAGSTAPLTGVQVVAVAPGDSVVASGPVSADGAYRLEVGRGYACIARIVAYIPGTPFPLESDAEFVTPPAIGCDGVVPGPDLVLPAASASVDTARVVGIVTSGGQPASATVMLVALSYVLGPIVVATTTTNAMGEYEVEGGIPEYYCNRLEVRTEPAAAARWPVEGCSASLVDISLSG